MAATLRANAGRCQKRSRRFFHGDCDHSARPRILMRDMATRSSFAIDVPAALLARARQGEREAFEQLYRWFERPVFTLALRICGDRVEANEVLQETMLKVWSATSGSGAGGFRGDGGSPFWGWLRQVAVNESLMSLRRGRRPERRTAWRRSGRARRRPRPAAAGRRRRRPAAACAGPVAACDPQRAVAVPRRRLYARRDRHRDAAQRELLEIATRARHPPPARPAASRRACRFRAYIQKGAGPCLIPAISTATTHRRRPRAGVMRSRPCRRTRRRLAAGSACKRVCLPRQRPRPRAQALAAVAGRCGVVGPGTGAAVADVARRRHPGASLTSAQRAVTPAPMMVDPGSRRHRAAGTATNRSRHVPMTAETPSRRPSRAARAHELESSTHRTRAAPGANRGGTGRRYPTGGIGRAHAIHRIAVCRIRAARTVCWRWCATSASPAVPARP